MILCLSGSMAEREHNKLAVPQSEIKPAVVSSLGKRFSAHLSSPGLWLLTERDAVWYGITILNCGAWGSLSVYDGQRRLLWTQPSSFTGSFTLGGYAEGGIIVDNGYGKSVATNVTVNWSE